MGFASTRAATQKAPAATVLVVLPVTPGSVALAPSLSTHWCPHKVAVHM